MYKVVISKIVDKETQSYQQVGETPTTKEDEVKSYASDKLPPMKAEYGYVKTTRSEDVEIFNQRVDELDITKVILAVNNIK